MYAFVFFLGAIVGACVAVLVMSLCVMAREG